jgi:hypothetical protein
VAVVILRAFGLVLLAVLLVALAVAAVGTLGWLLGASAVLAGAVYAVWRIRHPRPAPEPPVTTFRVTLDVPEQPSDEPADQLTLPLDPSERR